MAGVRANATWMMLGVTVAFAVLQFFQQGVCGILSGHLGREFDIDAAQTGILSSSLFFTFIVLQVPAGVLLDRFGVRRVVTSAGIILTVGSVVFCTAHSLDTAIAGRVVMGVGAAFGFLSTLTVAKTWFPPGRFPFLVALIETGSMLGVFLFNGVFSLMLEQLEWRSAYLFISIVTGLVTVVLWKVVRDKPRDLAILRPAKEFIPLAVLGDSRIWLYGLFSGANYCMVTVFVAMWGIPCLVSGYHLDAVQATVIASSIYVGIAIASPIIGWMAARFEILNLMLAGTLATLAVLLVVLFGSSYIGAGQLAVLCLVLGGSCSVYQLAFTKVAEISPNGSEAASFGLTNLLTMVGAPALQPLVGALISWQLDNKISDGFEKYTFAMYRNGLSALCFCLVMAAGIVIFLKHREKVSESA